MRRSLIAALVILGLGVSTPARANTKVAVLDLEAGKGAGKVASRITGQLRRLVGNTANLSIVAGKSLAGGWSEGRLSGGSLSLVVASLGTPWEIDTRGAILLLEEVGEDPYRVDRMLQQLIAAGKFASTVGVGIGSMTGCESQRYPTPSVTEVLEEVLAPLELPVVTELPFGHCDPHLSWPVGARAAIDGDRAEIELLEAGVSKR